MQASLHRALALVAVAVPGLVGCTMNEAGNLSALAQGDMSAGEPAWGDYDARLTDVCGPGEITDAGAASLARLPYIQDVRDRSAKLVWSSASETAMPAEVVVTESEGGEPVFIADATVDERAELAGGEALHVAELDGLEPGRVYCYKLRNGDGELTTSTGFYTAPERDQRVGFIALGDLGDGGSDQVAVLESMMKVVPDFAVLTGDIAYEDGKLSELEHNFFDVYPEMLARIPFFPAAGNHDVRTREGAALFQAFPMFDGERWYSFDFGNVHVAVIDTEVLDAEQAAWLAADLEASDRPWKIVVGHAPPYSSGSHGSDLDVREIFGPVFERQGVDLVLMGHDHDYERTKAIEGVTYVITGGGGRGTRPVDESDFTAFATEVEHFVYVDATADALTLYAIDATGAVFDTARIPADERAAELSATK